MEVKEKLAHAVNRFLGPIRDRRARYTAQPRLIEEIPHNGICRRRQESDETMDLVREAMRLEARPSPTGHSALPPDLIYC